MDKPFSGNRDTDLIIFEKLPDEDLLKICSLKTKSKYLYRICQDDSFWYRRSQKYFRNEVKPENLSWRRHYLTLMVNKYSEFKEAPLKFLAHLKIDKNKILYLLLPFSNVYHASQFSIPLEEANESVLANYYYLNLGDRIVNKQLYRNLTPQKLLDLFASDPRNFDENGQISGIFIYHKMVANEGRDPIDFDYYAFNKEIRRQGFY